MSKFSKVMLAAVVASLGSAAAANAATVTYTLALNDFGAGTLSTNSWALYADVSVGDNAGLAAFGAALTNYTSPTITNLRLAAGQFLDADTDPDTGDPLLPNLPTAFTTARFLELGHAISAAQDTTGPNYIITGVGQNTVAMAAVPKPAGYETYQNNAGGATMLAHVLLARGTFNPANPVAFDTTSQDTKANVFVSGTVNHKGTAATIPADIITHVINLADTGPINTGPVDTGPVNTGPNVPEPASLAVLGLGAAALMARRKKA